VIFSQGCYVVCKAWGQRRHQHSGPCKEREKGDVKQTARSLRTESKHYCDWLYLLKSKNFILLHFLFNCAANSQYMAVALVANNILLALLVRKRHQTLIPSILFLVFLPFLGGWVLWFIQDSQGFIIKREHNEVWGWTYKHLPWSLGVSVSATWSCFHLLPHFEECSPGVTVPSVSEWMSTCLGTSWDIFYFNY